MLPALSPMRVAARVIERSEETSFAEGFLERASAAALPAAPRNRDIRTPNNLSDLGVRASRDPLLFYQHNLQLDPALAGLADQTEPDDGSAQNAWIAAWDAGQVSVGQMKGALDAYVSFQGDWESACNLGRLIAESPRAIDNFQLALSVAAILGAVGNAASIENFDRAANIATTEIELFMCSVRRAACELKRFKRAGDALATLASADALAEQWVRDGLISAADRDALQAVSNNLRALAMLQTGAADEAHALMLSACELSNSDGLVTVGIDETLRYRAQIRMNLAQLRWRQGHHEEALSRMRDHLEATRREHPFSLSEALVFTGYLSYLMKDHATALDLLAEGEQLIAHEASPVRLEACRKIKLAVLNALSREADVLEVLEALNSDPLGLKTDSAIGRSGPNTSSMHSRPVALTV